MANEISFSIAINVSKNGASVSGSASLSQDLAGEQFSSNNQSVGTSNEALVLGTDLSTVGWIFVKNLDATNYVEVFLDNGNTQLVSKLLPGEATLFKPGTTSVYARANTAACICQVVALEL